MNTHLINCLMVLGCALPVSQTNAASTILNQNVSVDYLAHAFLLTPVTQMTTFEAIQPGPDFTADGPDGLPLFALDFASDILTITALRSYEDSGSLEFSWLLTLDTASELAFNSASLLSSSLFSIPPFTFPVDPTVGFDEDSKTISIYRFMAAGVGTAVVNAGGSAVISYTIIPEPSNCAMLTSGACTLVWIWRRRHAKKTAA